MPILTKRCGVGEMFSNPPWLHLFPVPRAGPSGSGKDMGQYRKFWDTLNAKSLSVCQ